MRIPHPGWYTVQCIELTGPEAAEIPSCEGKDIGYVLVEIQASLSTYIAGKNRASTSMVTRPPPQERDPGIKIYFHIKSEYQGVDSMFHHSFYSCELLQTTAVILLFVHFFQFAGTSPNRQYG